MVHEVLRLNQVNYHVKHKIMNKHSVLVRLLYGRRVVRVVRFACALWALTPEGPLETPHRMTWHLEGGTLSPVGAGD